MLKNIFFSLLNIIILTGCVELSGGSGDFPSAIEGHKWKLVSFGDNRVVATDRITLSLKSGHYSGWSGCNSMSGTYLLDGDKLVFDTDTPFHSGVSTMMACSNMGLETKFHEAIQKVNHYRIEGKYLIFLDKNHEILVFVRTTGS
ncbi:hypothetical protein YH65_10245 [Sulfurovum lithotrophicum]|uniref:DUF306 domain-containing protein n=1 Tax=Sulfurovum lithotrophicum TaxID=206403 RepID=A0A7U4RRB1_9BACT|nr:META domain-containing protein [Sulfurovum lithotrophicum]AKF25723.1 hypothetical protein YH65_10245 [Sulfurovum lithotrophicum]